MGVGVVGGVVTSPLLAGLFGSGGLSLTSYKMSRRTKGLGEFRLVRIVPEIEEGRGGKGADLAISNDKDDKGKSDKASKTDKTDKSDAVHEISEDNPDAHTLPRLSLLVMVGGFMLDEGDDRRGWGLLPLRMTSWERGMRALSCRCPREQRDGLMEERRRYEEVRRLRGYLGFAAPSASLTSSAVVLCALFDVDTWALRRLVPHLTCCGVM